MTAPLGILCLPTTAMRALRRPIAVGMAAACTMSVSAHTIGGSGDRLSSSRILFFGDLDGTLLGGAPGLATFCEHWLTIERPSGSMLAYNTGRCYTQYCQGMNSGLPGMHLGGALRGVLPTPDVLITGDGTEVRWLVDRASADMSIDTEWRARIREHWWSSGLRAAVIARMAADDQGIIPDLNSPANTDLPGGEARHAITLADAAQARRLCADLQREFSRSGVTFYTLDGWGQPKPKPNPIDRGQGERGTLRSRQARLREQRVRRSGRFVERREHARGRYAIHRSGQRERGSARAGGGKALRAAPLPRERLPR